MKYQDINFNFFEKIGSEEKAYFLGFMYSDGCVQQHCITLKLQKKDVSILEKLRDLISPSTPIKITQEKYCYFRINRKSICQQLINLGCTPNKSLTVTFPSEDQVPSHLIKHFIRGYSDGDGSIKYSALKTGRKNFSWSVTSTKDFCHSLSEHLKKIGVNSYIQMTNKSRKNIITHTLSVGGSLQLNKALDWIYQESNIHMDRKYNKYLEFKKQISSNFLQSKFAARGSFKLDEEQIINLYQQGYSKTKISELMNCNLKSVRLILNRNNLKILPMIN